MNYREEMFKTKFGDAARLLGVAPDQVISLKLRESVGSYSEYHHLLQTLEHEVGISWQEVDANLQGKGYLVGNTKIKVIVVEHETGLEILYIAGSIASLIGLIPLVLKFWSSIPGHHRRPHPRDFRSVEIRRLDSNGHLQEDRSLDLVAPWSDPLSYINTALSSAAEVIDTEIKQLRNDVRVLTDRVAKLEKKVSKSAKIMKKPLKKKP